MAEKIDAYTFTGPSEVELRGLTPQQQDALIESRRSEWARLRPLEIARQDARRAHIAEGGDGAAFDAQWAGGGETAHIAAEAKRRQERARQESSIF
jgi:enhancing lycopene biosynthesis protein 2